MDGRDFEALRMARSLAWDRRPGHEAVTTKKWWLIGPPLAALVLTIGLLLAGLLCLQSPRYCAEAQVLIGPRTVGLIGLRANVALFGGASGIGPAAGQAQLIASRDLARRAIRDLQIEVNPEFDAAARSADPVSRALIFLGILRDPARKSLEDRVLDTYQDRLRVSAPGMGSLLTIAFQSENPELAANAANHIAELYLEMRAGTGALPQNGEARIASRATPPSHRIYPTRPLMLLSGAAMLVMALGALVSAAATGSLGPGRPEEPLEQPRPLGQVRIAARPGDLGKPHLRATGEWGAEPEPAGHPEVGTGQVSAKIMARILAAPFARPGARGTRIVATSLGQAAASDVMRDFARDLAREGRSIVIGLDPSNSFDFGKLAGGGPDDGPADNEEPGLCDLLNGTATFAEVICRDPASRLHFLRAGRDGELNLDEFENVLDALAETYDFLLMIAPPLDVNNIAGTLASKADFALLASVARPQNGQVLEAEAQLIEAGAGEVLLIGLPDLSPQIIGRDAA
jgi:Mrp family chromosome partitioning ATPase